MDGKLSLGDLATVLGSLSVSFGLLCVAGGDCLAKILPVVQKELKR